MEMRDGEPPGDEGEGRPSRGKAVVEEFLGEVRPAFWVSDRFGAQMGWASTGHQACLAHHLSDVQYAIDAGDVAFASAIKDLLKQAAAIGRRRDRLKASTLAAYAAKLEAALDRLLRIEPIGGQGLKLLRIIKRFRQHLFVFVTHRDIPPTNNGSEQALRPCVVFRKVTNCFRSHWVPGSTPTSGPYSRLPDDAAYLSFNPFA